jgi:large subunit ribosomal protein L7/L12
MNDIQTQARDFRELGDQIANLSLKQAAELSRYLEQFHGLKPSRAGTVVVPPPIEQPKENAKTEFDVVLVGFDQEKRVSVIRAVRAVTGWPLKEARDSLDATLAKLKEGASQDDALKVKAEVEAAGGKVELR